MINNIQTDNVKRVYTVSEIMGILSISKTAAYNFIKSNPPFTLESYIDRWFDQHKQTLESNTINDNNTNIKNHIKPALGKIKLKDLKPANVCDNVKPPKYKAQLLAEEQMQKLMKALEGNRYETEIKLAMLLGLRRGEVLGLKFSDVDFARHTMKYKRRN